MVVDDRIQIDNAFLIFLRIINRQSLSATRLTAAAATLLVQVEEEDSHDDADYMGGKRIYKYFLEIFTWNPHVD